MLGGGLVTAAATAALAATHTLALAMPIMLVIGAAWLAVMSSLMVAAQVALPEWVKARGLAVTQMVFNGGLMFGSVLWGVVADQWGIPWALVLSAGGLAAASVATLRWRLPGDDSLDLRPSRHWPAPVVKESLPGDRGPVLVTVEYTVAPEDRDAFAAALAANAHIRRRDGAIYWHHFIDTADPRRHLEVFVVESWLEHMRQHERVTRADLAIEAEVRKFHLGSGPAARVAFHQRDLAGVMMAAATVARSSRVPDRCEGTIRAGASCRALAHSSGARMA